MKVSERIKKNLAEAKVMQIATTHGGQPWICTVYFIADEEQNLYWLSLPGRRHSREVDAHSRVAVAVPIKFDQPVIGLQAEGVAEEVQDAEVVKRIIPGYIAKYGAGKDFYDNFVRGTAQHALYRFTPKKIVLFDEVNYINDPRKERAARSL